MSDTLFIAYFQGGFPPPQKKRKRNGQNRVAVAGHNKGDTLESFQFRTAIMKQYDKTEQ